MTASYRRERVGQFGFGFVKQDVEGWCDTGDLGVTATEASGPASREGARDKRMS